ncbi:glycosyltransferase involved in cell wall biosynthesis [Variovorax boronicumulans]|uniref:glycosyltransferase n=1 Tax=Variovorax boronicumulans TaxID=436515 RepID=UPI00277FAE2D|nr:glycosyltransferase [Variovorax boronicumulans]MDQ0016917.1 glycosyltransferase involved in cell wall biosynthesis [Variovorax boronicumulans]
MRIVIDLQGAQSNGSRHRGIGRYSLSLAQAMAQHTRGHEFWLALNGHFPDSVEDIKVAFDGLIDPACVKVWRPAAQSGSAARASGDVQADEKLYEAFLSSLAPDAIHVSSLFEGLGDASITSIGRFARTPTAVTLYDLIPLINPQPYLDNPVIRDWYMGKVKAMERASLWLAISESSRQEGLSQLGLDAARCVNVSTAASDHFRKVDVPEGRIQELRARYRLHKPFVMYTGGIDHRKNIEGLIRAFALIPPTLRSGHQLAIVCSARAEDREALLALARKQGLAEGDVAVTGFVPEQDLIDLYNLCALFVFPSWHEGFGLPALEAMLCGAPVIGANTSSLPEVIGWDDAMFDPRNDSAIAAKMSQALEDDAFRKALVEHGTKQSKKFSWDESARRALAAFEQMHESIGAAAKAPRMAIGKSRPRLAYVSPLPPERSGIANYSAELLPELAKFYDIELITDLKAIDKRELPVSFPLRTVEWFRTNGSAFDRVLYHFGNSEFHQHMFGLLQEIPGVVVLHDFYLSGVQAHREIVGKEHFNWTHALYESHGYRAVADRAHAADSAEVVFRYPCNFDVLRLASGVVVHSQYSAMLGTEWFGPTLADKWALIPHLRVIPESIESARARARADLGLDSEEFLVCAFGLLGPTKLNHRLHEAWLKSSLAQDPKCRLVFVGENEKGPYGQRLERAIGQAQGRSGVSITGWADSETFHRYLSAADVAVQLRTLSRGETSGTVLDAMSRGVPTIVNANGSMASLPTDAVMMLPDEFTNDELIAMLEKLRHSPEAAKALGQRGKHRIETAHAPAACAQAYSDAIESFAADAEYSRIGLISSIASDLELSETSLVQAARSIARALPLPAPARQIFVDVSELVQKDWQSGIQRLVKSMLRALFEAPPDGYRIEPVYALKGTPGYNYARKFALRFLGCGSESLQDAPIDAREGDVFVGLDLQPHIVLEQTAFYRELQQIGVHVEFVVYDLLPVLLSHRFFDGAKELHERWLKAISESNGVLAISNAVADEFTAWASANVPERIAAGLKVGVFHLGADIASSTSTASIPAHAASTLALIAKAPSFLMVGTIEPRKGHEQALSAFEQLWRDGTDVNLVIVGKAGWMVEALVERLRQHPQRGRRLFWLEGVSDEYLERLYDTCACLLLASEGEGFGLPLIEAAAHKLPIVARNLPVFREVATDHAFYFDGMTSDALASAVEQWLVLLRKEEHPRSETMPHLTWRQSAEQFKAALLGAR